MKKYILKYILIMLVAVLICNNLTIACEVDEQDNSESDVEPQDDESDNDSFTIFEKLIERYPILDQIINLLLKLLNNFLQGLDLSSV